MPTDVQTLFLGTRLVPLKTKTRREALAARDPTPNATYVGACSTKMDATKYISVHDVYIMIRV